MQFHLKGQKETDYYAHSRFEMLKYIPLDTNNILEFGCSNGAFGSIVKSKITCTYTGIEPFEESANIASKILDRVIQSTAEEYINFVMPKETLLYDTIVFNDVLEHLVNPEEILNSVRAILTPNAVIVASIPNFIYYPNLVEIIVKRDWEYKESGILDKTHLRFFTKKSIIRLFENAGYRITKIEGINPFASRKFQLINWVALNRLNEFRFLQYAVSAIQT
ncbi:MAG: class I SAM-dependent methyltransferase [Saprospiraceae bacterium]|nr:class I SAM-dependent methyltransferase [Saprospiraceae bacterium]